MTTDLVTLYVTFPNHDDASRICTDLVAKDIIACANIIEGGQSLYKWDGVVSFENEVVVFMKTHRYRVEDAIERIKEMHSFDVPCITQLEITGGNPDYLKWVENSVENYSLSKTGQKVNHDEYGEIQQDATEVSDFHDKAEMVNFHGD